METVVVVAALVLVLMLGGRDGNVSTHLSTRSKSWSVCPRLRDRFFLPPPKGGVTRGGDVGLDGGGAVANAPMPNPANVAKIPAPTVASVFDIRAWRSAFAFLSSLFEQK